MLKSIVITGCSSGFGRCTALELARQGWRVFATVRKEEDRASLLQEAETLGSQANLTPLLCDIVQVHQVHALARQVEDLLRDDSGEADSPPRLHALLNNAGTAYGAPIEMIPLDDLRAQLEINVVAHVAVTQAFLPLLKAARGIIINVSSISGRLVTPVTGPYAASKHALEAISHALRLELAPFGVRVVIIEPASSPTSIWKTSLARSMEHLGAQVVGSPYERLLHNTIKIVEQSSLQGFPPQRFARLVVKILNTTNPRACYGIPVSVAATIFIHRLLPDALWDRLIRQIVNW